MWLPVSNVTGEGAMFTNKRWRIHGIGDLAGISGG